MTARPFTFADTPALIAALRALDGAGTPGPWYDPADTEPHRNPGNYIVSDRANICGLHDGGTLSGEQQANARLIAASRNVLPALIDDIERLWNRHQPNTWEALPHGVWPVCMCSDRNTIWPCPELLARLPLLEALWNEVGGAG